MPSFTPTNIINLFGKFQGLKHLVLGIDQGSSTLRYVLVDINKQRVLKWGACDYAFAEKDKLAALNYLKELAKSIPVAKLRCVNINIQGSAVTIGQLEIPPGDKNELPNMVRLALRSQLPFPVEDSAYYYRESGKKTVTQTKTSEDGAKVKRIFNFVALEKKILSSVMDPIIDIFKLIPNVTIQGYAYENLIELLELSKPGESIALLNIGKSLTAISIFEGKELVFEREFPLAGQDITRSILILFRSESSENMLSLEDAEKIKRMSGIPASAVSYDAGSSENEVQEKKSEGSEPGQPLNESQNQKLFQSMQGVLAAWAQDIRLSFDYFYDHYQAGRVSKIYVLGGAANLKNLIPYLNRQLGIETRLLTFQEKSPISLTRAKDPEPFKTVFHEYALALAHALRIDFRTNLNPQTFQTVTYSNLFISVFRTVFISIAAILLTIYMFFSVQSIYLKNLKNVLTEHRQFLGEVEAPYLRMIEWQDFLKKTDDFTFPASLIFKVISQVTPENIILDKLSVDRDQNAVTIGGTITGDPRIQAMTLANFSKVLGASSYFKQIEIPLMEPTPNLTDQATFRLSAVMTKGRAR